MELTNGSPIDCIVAVKKIGAYRRPKKLKSGYASIDGHICHSLHRYVSVGCPRLPCPTLPMRLLSLFEVTEASSGCTFRPSGDSV